MWEQERRLEDQFVVQSLSHFWLFVTPMDCSTPGFPVLHCLLEFAHTHVYGVSDAIHPDYPSHPLWSPSPPALNLSQHQGHFQWVSLCNRCPKDRNSSLSISPSNEYSGLISFRIDWFPCNPRDSQESSLASQFKGINSSAFSLLYGPTLTSTHDYWESHSFDYMDNIPIYYAGSVHKETNKLSPYLTEFTCGRW